MTSTFHSTLTLDDNFFHENRLPADDYYETSCLINTENIVLILYMACGFTAMPTDAQSKKEGEDQEYHT